MSKGKLIVMILTIALLTVVFASTSNAWPSSDQGGGYYTMHVDAANAPKIDGKTSSSEWTTKEENFQDTIGTKLVYNNGKSAEGVTLGVVLLTDGTYLYVKVTWENTVTSLKQNNSIGIAFSEQVPKVMAQTYDRKFAYWNGSTSNPAVNTTDLFNCLNVGTQLCSTDSNYVRPGVPDSKTEFTAAFGMDSVQNKPFYEFKIPMTATNGTEDLSITAGTVLNFVVNPYQNIGENDNGHGGIATNPLTVQFNPRCTFCRPTDGIINNTSALIFNVFFAVLISGIYLTFIYSGRNEEFAEKIWKIDVTEDNAKESVLLEMAYYNSSFISVVIASFFLIFSIVGFAYGIWANWGIPGIIIYGIPTLLGILAISDLMKRNKNPAEMEHRPGISYDESEKFWLVPTLFLATTLLMLVFIGINVIAG